MGGLLWSVENIQNITSFKITDFPSNSYQFQIVSWLTLDFVLTSILPVKILSILSLVRSVHAVTVSLCSYVHPSYGVWKALCLGVIYVSGSSNILLIHGPLNCEVKGVMKIFTIQMSVPKSFTLWKCTVVCLLVNYHLLKKSFFKKGWVIQLSVSITACH